MKKLTKPKIPQENKTILTNNLGFKKKHPEINFKYLYKCNIGCFNKLNKYHNRHKEEKVFDQLQKFLFEVDNCSSLEELITQYTSKSGSKIDSSNYYIKRLKKEFENAYPDERGLLESGIVHLHLKRNGLGKFVIFGVNYDSIFYVLSFDPEHSFSN